MPTCRVTLKEIGQDGYSPAGRRALVGGQGKIPFRLPFSREDVIQHRGEKVTELSISGVQDKISLKLERGKLTPVTSGGEFILKPIPSGISLKNLEAVPANEHLTMQLASQVFKIPTPACAVVELAYGEPAYLVRRFDRNPDGSKRTQEDFCQLSQRSPETHGNQYKYDSSMEETGRILRRFCSAYAIQIEDLFRRHVFNYVFSNGDAHLKNFSLGESPQGDHLLTPAYDLLCTALHIPNEARCALDLFADETETDFYKKNGFYGRPDFVLLAERFGIADDVARSILNGFHGEKDAATKLIRRSFLSAELREEYAERMDDRLQAIR